VGKFEARRVLAAFADSEVGDTAGLEALEACATSNAVKPVKHGQG
jgi:hypothetical protein